MDPTAAGARTWVVDHAGSTASPARTTPEDGAGATPAPGNAGAEATDAGTDGAAGTREGVDVGVPPGATA